MQYMSIDKNEVLHNREKKIWEKYGISSIRVDSMIEGIIKAKEQEFLFIVINADSIDYMPKLQVLRSVTDAPILIAASTYTAKEHTEALNNGADDFGPIEDPKSNREAVLAILEKINKYKSQNASKAKIICFKDILLMPDYRRVFINDEEVTLTRMEFDVLHFLLLNQGRVLSHEQIYNYVFAEENYDPAYDSIKSSIKRLRKKIGAREIIDSVRGVGYKIGF